MIPTIHIIPSGEAVAATISKAARAREAAAREAAVTASHPPRKAAKHLPSTIKLHSLKLQETESSYAEWFASDN